MMLHLSRSRLWFLTIFALVGCAKGDGEEEEPLASIGSIRLDSTLTKQDRTALLEAFNRLDATGSLDADPELLNYLHVNQVTGSVLRKWIEDRTQYVVSESPMASEVVLDQNYRYENPDRLPPDLTNSNAEKENVMVMYNWGAVEYAKGKREKKLRGLDILGLGMIRITSPRVGVLVMGEGFRRAYSEEFPNLVRIFRIATLVHESRHSDGNSEHAGFFHAKCEGGTFDGVRQCDSVKNGPFGLEAMVVQAFTKSCSSCSATEKDALQTLYFDAASRLTHGRASGIWDDTPEGRR